MLPVKTISQIIWVFFLSMFFGLGMGVGTAPLRAELPPDRHTEKNLEFFIRRAEIIKMPTPPALAMNIFPLPQNIPQSSEMRYIISLNMAVLRNGQSWPFDDKTVFQYELRDTQGRAMKFLNEERGGRDGAARPPAEPRHAIPGPDSVALYFQSFDEIRENLILKVSVSPQELFSPFELLIPIDEICFVPGGTPNKIPQDTDIDILFPRNNTRVRRGQTVPLKIQFAEDVKKPDKLLILSPFYSLEDKDVSGQYSLRIESDASLGLYEVLIIGVWNMGSQEITASKLLSFKVIDKEPGPPPFVCPLSRRK
jgi:hypothetical protein